MLVCSDVRCFQVLGSDYQEALKERIDADQIPLEYGGTATYKLPGRPDEWSDVEDDDHELGYHPITLSKEKTPKEAKAEKRSSGWW